MSFRWKCSAALSACVLVSAVVAQDAPMAHLSPGTARKPVPSAE